MKIVYCIAGTYNSGGMERVLASKANWLSEHGYEVSIVTTDQKGRKPFFSLNEEIKTYDLGINYADNNGRSFGNKLVHYPVKQWKHKSKLSHLLKKLRADMVVCMFNNDASFICNIKDGSRKILEIHFSKFKKLQYGRKGLWKLADEWRTKQEEKTVRRFDKFVVLTEEDKSYWGNVPNIIVIPNARTFETEDMAALDNKIVLAVGRLEYQKGFDRLIEIWKKVCSYTNCWNLVIVGDGSMREMLQKQIDELGISDRTIIVRGTNDIKNYYMNVSIVVMTSRYEGLPMALLEAQTFGLPIVSYACKCGPKDIVSDGVDGFIVPENAEARFVYRMVELMNKDELRKKMGGEAKKSSEHFSQNNIMQKWTNLFESMTQE